MIEVLRDDFIPLIPSTLAKTIDLLASSIEEQNETARLHNAAYAFVSAMLLYLPWLLQGGDLERLLQASYQSANAEMGDEANQVRHDALQLVGRFVDPKACLMALNRTWAVAMSEGPLVILPPPYLSLMELIQIRR